MMDIYAVSSFFSLLQMVFNILKVQHSFCKDSAWTFLNFSGEKKKSSPGKAGGVGGLEALVRLAPSGGPGKMFRGA